MDWTYDILDLKFQNETHIHTYLHACTSTQYPTPHRQAKFVIVRQANFNPYEINSHETNLLTHIYFCKIAGVKFRFLSDKYKFQNLVIIVWYEDQTQQNPHYLMPLEYNAI